MNKLLHRRPWLGFPHNICTHFSKKRKNRRRWDLLHRLNPQSLLSLQAGSEDPTTTVQITTKRLGIVRKQEERKQSGRWIRTLLKPFIIRTTVWWSSSRNIMAIFRNKLRNGPSVLMCKWSALCSGRRIPYWFCHSYTTVREDLTQKQSMKKQPCDCSHFSWWTLPKLLSHTFCAPRITMSLEKKESSLHNIRFWSTC